jgi:hypothetical protein
VPTPSISVEEASDEEDNNSEESIIHISIDTELYEKCLNAKGDEASRLAVLPASFVNLYKNALMAYQDCCTIH